MQFIPPEILTGALVGLPALLQSSLGWKTLKYQTGYIAIERLHRDFGKFTLALDRRTWRGAENTDIFPVRERAFREQVVSGAEEVFLFSPRKGARGKLDIVAHILAGPGSRYGFRRDSILAYRMNTAETLTVSVCRYPVIFEKAETLEPDVVNSILATFRGHFP